jgi:hypothetical protein
MVEECDFCGYVLPSGPALPPYRRKARSPVPAPPNFTGSTKQNLPKEEAVLDSLRQPLSLFICLGMDRLEESRVLYRTKIEHIKPIGDFQPLFFENFLLGISPFAFPVMEHCEGLPQISAARGLKTQNASFIFTFR